MGKPCRFSLPGQPPNKAAPPALNRRPRSPAAKSGRLHPTARPAPAGGISPHQPAATPSWPCRSTNRVEMWRLAGTPRMGAQAAWAYSHVAISADGILHPPLQSASGQGLAAACIQLHLQLQLPYRRPTQQPIFRSLDLGNRQPMARRVRSDNPYQPRRTGQRSSTSSQHIVCQPAPQFAFSTREIRCV